MTKGNILYLYETATGLGHQRRASGIVNALVVAGFNVCVASGTFVEPEQYFDSRAQLIQLPEHRKHIDGQYYFYDNENRRVLDPDFDPEKWKRDRAEAVCAHTDLTKIDAVIGEWWPFKRRREFDSIVELVLANQVRNFGARPLVLSSVRDVLTKFDDPSSEKAEKAEMEVVEAINAMVDGILVHGDPEFVRLEDTFSRCTLFAKPVHYTGYVVNEGAKSGSTICVRDKTVVVSCGSGDNGQHLLGAALKARPHSILRDHEWLYVLGPRISPEGRDEFLSLVPQFNTAAANGHLLPEQPAPQLNTAADEHSLPLQIRDQMPDLPHVLCHAGFHISYSGYNTTLETVTSGVPALLVPKMRIGSAGFKFDQEQWRRLERLRDRQMASIAHPDAVLEPRRFAELIDAAYQKGSPTVRLDTDGAARTAALIGEMLEHRL